MHSCDDVASCVNILLKGPLCVKEAQILSENKDFKARQTGRNSKCGVYTACVYVTIGVRIRMRDISIACCRIWWLPHTDGLLSTSTLESFTVLARGSEQAFLSHQQPFSHLYYYNTYIPIMCTE